MSEKESKEMEDLRQSILSILNRCANRTQILGDNRMHSFIVEDEFDNVVRQLELSVDFTFKLREWVISNILEGYRIMPCSDKEREICTLVQYAQQNMPEQSQLEHKDIIGAIHKHAKELPNGGLTDADIEFMNHKQ